MPNVNVKLVIIGASGVGKTSLRTKYTSGRFSQNYRATIGADFITKTIPHPSHSEDTVQLQIWDTAGQERFSSLATAFFRGADAVILVYDLTSPESLSSLTKWWDEFRTRAPIEEGEEAEFPVAIVGNKLDMIEGKDTGTWRVKHRRMSSSGSVDDKVVTEEEAREFLKTLIPLPEGYHEEEEAEVPKANGTSNGHAEPSKAPPSASSVVHRSISNPSPIPDSSRQRTTSERTDSRATSRSRYANGTMTTTTAMSIYHTASSSLIDSSPPTPSRRQSQNITNGVFWDPEVEQAIAANAEGLVGEGEVALDSGYRSVSPLSPAGAPSEPSQNATKSGALLEPDSAASSFRRRLASSNSSSSVQTVRPSRVNSSQSVPQPGESSQRTKISKPALGPELFLTSAKTGEGLNDVFEYIAKRVTKKWEWDEYRMSIQEGSPTLGMNGDSRIILRELRDGQGKDGKKYGCC